MDFTFFITSFVTLFVIIDPIGVTPVFISLTRGSDSKMRAKVALRASVVGLCILLVFTFVGDSLLGFIGISMPAFAIAGGILLFLTALEMLFEKRSARRNSKGQLEIQDPSVFPIAVPLLAGPGSLASAILLGNQAQNSTETLMLVGAIITIFVMTSILFYASGLLERLLGDTGINVVTRILGMLLAALSVQFVLDGLRAVDLV